MSETRPSYPTAQAEALRLMQCPIAGFQYHGGEACWGRMRAGDRLVLRREPGNRHDPRAITVEWQDVMLGFIPREANYALSQMMDSGMRVAGQVAALRTGSDPWQRVMIDVVAYPAAAAMPKEAQPPPQRVILKPALKLVLPRLRAAQGGGLSAGQREVGMAVVRDCVPEIARRLADPIVGIRHEHGREVNAWNSIGIAVDAEGRSLRTRYLEAPASAGPGATLDLKRPLGEDGWLASFVAVIAQVCDRHGLDKENMGEPLRRWVGTSLQLTFADVVDFEALRKAALEFLAPDPLARSLANRIFGASPSAEAFNWVCGRAFTAIALCAVEHPTMLPFLRIVHGDKRMNAAIDPLAALRERLIDEGLTPAAWNKLAGWGFGAFEPLGEAWLKPIPVARFANLLQRLEVNDPPRRGFAAFALTAALHRVQPNAKLDFERHPLWFMRALLREASSRDPAASVALRHDLPGCLDWLTETSPTPDANQQRAGWRWIWQQAQAWREASELARAAPWPVPLREMQWGPYIVVAIGSAQELAAEAQAMKNCLANYEDACRCGDVVAFSIRQRATGKRLACFAVEQDGDDGRWTVVEVAGKMNAEVDAEMARIAEATTVKLNGGRGGDVPPF